MRLRLFSVLTVVIAATLFLPTVHGNAAVKRRPRTEGTIRTVVVRPGDTLWGLGARYAAKDCDLRLWIAAVEQMNRLPRAALQPGQALMLPRGPT